MALVLRDTTVHLSSNLSLRLLISQSGLVHHSFKQMNTSVDMLDGFVQRVLHIHRKCVVDIILLEAMKMELLVNLRLCVLEASTVLMVSLFLARREVMEAKRARQTKVALDSVHLLTIARRERVTPFLVLTSLILPEDCGHVMLAQAHQIQMPPLLVKTTDHAASEIRLFVVILSLFLCLLRSRYCDEIICCFVSNAPL